MVCLNQGFKKLKTIAALNQLPLFYLQTLKYIDLVQNNLQPSINRNNSNL